MNLKSISIRIFKGLLLFFLLLIVAFYVITLYHGADMNISIKEINNNSSKKLIIIHGADTLSSDNKYIQKVISFIYRKFFNFIPENGENFPWVKTNWEEFDVKSISWSGRIIPYDVKKAAEEVKNILNKNVNDEYYFLTKSMGTEIALLAIENSEIKNIKGMVSFSPVNKPRKINNFPVIFIKSNEDIFSIFAHKILWPLYSFLETEGRIENIILKNVRHDQFVPDFIMKDDITMKEFAKKKLNSF